MERICSLGEQILSFKSNPQILSDTVSTIKLKNKIDFFICQRVWKQQNVREKLGKSQGIWRWMISGNPDLRQSKVYQILVKKFISSHKL